MEIDIRTEPALVGDIYLICSDGLHGMVPDPGLLALIQQTPDLEAVCDALIDAANANGGEDNVTAVLVRIDAE